MRRLRIKTLIGCLSSVIALSHGACGKDKPEAVAGGEAPLEVQANSDAEAKPAEDASSSVPSSEADATAERPRRPPRDKNLQRRPPPVKHGGADATTGQGGPSVAGDVDAQGGTGLPAEPGLTPGAAPIEGQPASPAANPSTIVSGGIPGMPVPEPAPTPGEPKGEPNPASPPAEPAEGPGRQNGQPSREAETLLPMSVIQEQLGAVRLTALGALPGIAVRPGYSSVFYGRPDGTKFGLSLQVWQDPSRNDSEERYRRMRLQYPNGEEVSVLTPAKAFFSQFGGVQTLTFVDSVTRTVVSVACGEGICTHEQLTKLAKAIRARF
jgi:hypothetical protein